MKKIINKAVLFLMLCTLTSVGFSQIPNGYYNNAQGKTGNELKTALHNIIKDHTVVSYGGLLDAFAYTDCDANGKIWDIYSNKRWNLNQDGGNCSSEGVSWNREHTWPQSWFNEKTGPKSDLFHVMPTDCYVNNRRSNYPYGEVSNPTYTSGNGSKLGNCTTSGYSGIVFEPVDEYKGDIARNFFYMSVRYYGEDSGWSSSGMTDHSVIKDWAMTMLLRWSDNDPVSQKEIDRNNAVFGYQSNRNPFIDHPEYARMIWDSNWTEGASYNITCESNLLHGSISAPETATEGTTVAITATPDLGYMVDSYSVYKTGSPSTTVSVSSNGTFIMPDYAVTISATFKQNTTQYTITTAEVTHGSISVSTDRALSGAIIQLFATPDPGYSLYSWYVYKTGDMNTNVYYGTNGSFVMPAFNVTVNATFSTQGGSANGDFVKVTENLGDWSGEYLIVYEEGNVAFNGGLSTLDAVSNTINVTISNNTIAANQTTNSAKFTIAKSGDDYTIKSSSGNYIGKTADSNGLDSSTSNAYANSISYNGTSTDVIGSGGAHLRFNNGSDQKRFRYFKSTTYTSQKEIQLFKRAVSVETPTHTIHFHPNGATGSSYDQTVEEYVPTALNSNTFTREGFVFDGWNTQANGEGTYYADNANVTLIDDLDLYAQWEPEYTITLIQPENGSISANTTSAIAESTITLTASANEGYELDSWIVTDGPGNNIEVVENQFEMPTDNVTVSATFVVQSVTYESLYIKVTTAPTDWSGDYLIVYEDGSVAFNGGLTTLDATSNTITVNITNDTIIFSPETGDAEFSIASSTNGKYSIKSASGLYIGKANDTNGLDASATPLDNTITLDNDAVVNIIGDGGARLRYNNSAGQNRFRYYKSNSYSSQKPIHLYKRTSIQNDEDEPALQNYYLVTSTEQLVAGRSYLIVNIDAKKGLSKTQNNNNRPATDIILAGDTITDIGEACELILGGESNAWSFFDAGYGTNGGYLYAGSSTANQLKTQATNDDNGLWTISIDANGAATLRAKGSNSRNWLRYNANNGNPIFNCYSSGQLDVYLFVRSEEFEHNNDETIANLFYHDKHTVGSDATLTITGNANSIKPEMLVLEDGAQLIHHSDGVKATVKRTIAAYTDDGGWFTIAMPIGNLDPTKVEGMTDESYDLYTYDEDAELEWINHKGEDGEFNLLTGQGYLYAHNPGLVIEAQGTLNNGDLTQNVNLSYANSHEDIRGFNLLGNPTAHTIQFSKTEAVSDGYYYLNDSNDWTYEPTNTVPVGRGFLVKANATNQSIVLNPQTRSNDDFATTIHESSLKNYVGITIDDETVYVKTTEGVSMPLIRFKGKTYGLYLSRDNSNYVMLTRGNAESIDLCYKPIKAGQHTLTVNCEAVGYLHLIDRMTGIETDLTQNPSYTFQSSTNNYDHRFQLVFAPQEKTADNNDSFAYISDGRIMVTTDTPDASLQVMDTLGRTIVERVIETSNYGVSTTGMAPGVYLLHLTTPHGTKTQKITVD